MGSTVLCRKSNIVVRCKVFGDTDFTNQEQTSLCSSSFIFLMIVCLYKHLMTDVATVFENFQKALDNAGPCSTSELEGFHSQLNRNAPKMEGFSYSGMLSRYEYVLYLILVLYVGSFVATKTVCLHLPSQLCSLWFPAPTKFYKFAEEPFSREWCFMVSLPITGMQPIFLVLTLH